MQNWRPINLSVQNWHEEFDEFWPEHSKILHFNGVFLKWHEELGKFSFIGWKSKMVELNQNKI